MSSFSYTSNFSVTSSALCPSLYSLINPHHECSSPQCGVVSFFPQADTVMIYTLTMIMAHTYHYSIVCSVMEDLSILQDHKITQ